MDGWLCEEFELRPVYLEPVDLLMMEGDATDDHTRAEELSSGDAQSGIGRERPVFGEP